MLTTSKQPPEFESPFLQDLAAAFRRRGKALRYRGTLEFVHPLGEDMEWLTASWSFYNHPEVTLQVLEDRRMHVYGESRTRRDYGKVLLRIEHMQATGAGAEIVAAFEATTSLVKPGRATVDEIRAEWRRVALMAH